MRASRVRGNLRLSADVFISFHEAEPFQNGNSRIAKLFAQIDRLIRAAVFSLFGESSARLLPTNAIFKPSNWL